MLFTLSLYTFLQRMCEEMFLHTYFIPTPYATKPLLTFQIQDATCVFRPYTTQGSDARVSWTDWSCYYYEVVVDKVALYKYPNVFLPQFTFDRVHRYAKLGDDVFELARQEARSIPGYECFVYHWLLSEAARG